MEAIVLTILSIFFATCAVLKIREYSQIFPSWGIFGHVTHLVQSRANEKIWWIIKSSIWSTENDMKIGLIIAVMHTNLSSCKIKAWKKFRPEQDLNHNAEVRGSNPVQAWIFSQAFYCIAALLYLVRSTFSALNKVDFDCIAGDFALLLILV